MTHYHVYLAARKKGAPRTARPTMFWLWERNKQLNPHDTADTEHQSAWWTNAAARKAIQGMGDSREFLIRKCDYPDCAPADPAE